jgi:leader peptidase (prepilin peptidase)/N-methyltransferase
LLDGKILSSSNEYERATTPSYGPSPLSISEYLFAHPQLTLFAGFAFGLCVGSFLNVVIHRLPIMMERDWRTQCADLEEQESPSDKEVEPAYNLVVPRSCCPHCKHQISALSNIPLLSYIFLRGRCGHCKGPISIRYPAIELLGGLIALAVMWHFGPTLQGLGALGLSFALLALAAIDFDTLYLPDSITLPLLWAGLIFNINGTFVSLDSAVIGAMAGYLSLWSIYWLFKLVTGKEGMGYGDFKLLAALGAWLGWSLLPAIILLSSMVGAVIGVSIILIRGHDRQIPIPFGPYLAIAGWICLIWGDLFANLYSIGPGPGL